MTNLTSNPLLETWTGCHAYFKNSKDVNHLVNLVELHGFGTIVTQWIYSNNVWGLIKVISNHIWGPMNSSAIITFEDIDSLLYHIEKAHCV